MLCPYCNVELVKGKAIDPGDLEERCCRCFGQIFVITAETLKLIDVLKCPKCGHSELIE